MVASLIGSSYVFWQQSLDNDAGGGAKLPNAHAHDFLTRYHIPPGSAEFPIILLIDPRTNELVQSHVGFMPPAQAAERLSDFATSHRCVPPSPGASRPRTGASPQSRCESTSHRCVGRGMRAPCPARPPRPPARPPAWPLAA